MATRPDPKPGAQVAIAFAADGDGRTYIDRQRVTYPFHICRPHYLDAAPPGLASLYIQSCSGGLYENDSLELDFATGAGAEVYVTTQSPTVVHSMPNGAARQRVSVAAGEGSHVEYVPDPQVLFPNSRLQSNVHVRLADGATAIIADAFLRHDPKQNGGVFSSYTSEIVIGGATGETLAIDRLAIDGSLFASEHPGISGRFRAQATLIVARRGGIPHAVSAALEQVPCSDQAAIGISRLPNSAGIVVRMLAADGVSLRQVLQACWATARFALKGAYPAERRK
ncbi:MAG TPA: urease accessory protein UreD [Aestuariivirgaceae bacterium]|nr:urease accessory protein UreD [Aestuariivirgaceae bacterium]